MPQEFFSEGIRMFSKNMSSMTVLLAAAAFAVTAGAQQTSPRSTKPVPPAHTSSASPSPADAANLNETAAATAQAGRATASAEQAANVSAQLTKSIDSKHAKVGEEVLAKTTRNATLADGTKLPKGSRLIGHVTQVQAKSRAQHDGQLAFSFDHAILRNGREVPIHAVMESIAAPAPLTASDDMMGGGDMGAGPAMAGGGGVMRGGVSRGGGVLGGGGGLAGSAAAPVGGAMRGAANGAGNLAGSTASGLNGAGQGTLNSTASLGRNTAALNGAAGGNSALSGGTFPVGNLSGVSFTNLNAAGAASRLASSTATNGSASASRHGVAGSAGAQNATLFTAHNKNVDLVGGSQMTMGISPQSR
jgi:hypothetical protein